jgi:hypothetical protein
MTMLLEDIQDAFASVEDVQARRGLGAFTDAETATVEQLLLAATSIIAATADKTDEWAINLDPIPEILRFLCVELVIRVLRNPGGLRSQTEQIGQHSRSESYVVDARGGAATGLLPTTVEELLIRRVVWSRNSGSARMRSAADDLLCYDGDWPGS